MMKKNTIKSFKLAAKLILGVLIFISCTNNFGEINRPGGSLSNEELNRDNYRSGVFFITLQDNSFPAQENNYQMNQNLIGDYYGRYMMYTSAGWSPANFTTYNAPKGWVDYPFSNVMTSIYSAWNEIAKATNKTGVNFAWAQILRIQAMQRLTDMYGPLPYSKITGEDLKTSYDTQEEVYKNMFNDLNEAIATFKSYIASNPQGKPFGSFDKVYGGDMNKWFKFANSLKLRMAIRIRYANSQFAQQMGEEAVRSGVITSNADNAKEIYAKNPIEVMWNSYGDARLAADMDAFLNGYKDPRASSYAQKSHIEGAERNIVGLRSGANVTNQENARKYSSPVAATNDPVLWLSAAEVAFCRAEGALAGWAGMGGSAEELYNEGIKLSFEQWGASGADNYIVDEALSQSAYTDPLKVGGDQAAVSTITIKWKSSDSAEKQLERLITQKWIALWPNGHEAWCEIRRTGYPQIFPLAQSTNYGTMKVANRIPFNSNEYINNRTNVEAAVAVMGGKDDYATKMWWQKK
ncbi:MAG: SusD/RagB family nutrient-binding outer membrane lipoprotein [Bacteroidia bacterium]|nr:SusD/RagB family nutrient-binding outer membrane lipoprotein [Bacteroidia bacterium]